MCHQAAIDPSRGKLEKVGIWLQVGTSGLCLKKDGVCRAGLGPGWDFNPQHCGRAITPQQCQLMKQLLAKKHPPGTSWSLCCPWECHRALQVPALGALSACPGKQPLFKPGFPTVALGCKFNPACAASRPNRGLLC